MTAVQMGLTIAVCTAATMLTRFLPFLIFSSKEQQPPEWCLSRKAGIVRCCLKTPAAPAVHSKKCPPPR